MPHRRPLLGCANPWSLRVRTPTVDSIVAIAIVSLACGAKTPAERTDTATNSGEPAAPEPAWTPPTAPDFETAHLQVWDFGPEPLCAGQLTELEAEATRLLDEMGLGLPAGELRLAWGSAASAELCDYPFAVNGCSRGKGAQAYVATNRESASHELVHGIRNANSLRTHVFFEEGLAEHLGAKRPLGTYLAWRPPELDAYGPTSLLELSSDEFFAGADIYGDFYDIEAKLKAMRDKRKEGIGVK